MYVASVSIAINKKFPANHLLLGFLNGALDAALQSAVWAAGPSKTT